MSRRILALGWVLGWVLAGVGLLASALAVRWTGAAEPLVFVSDAGPLVRWSAPLVRVVQHLAAAVTLGALLVGLVVVRAPRLALVAGTAALVWAATALAGVVLTFADAAGLPLGAPGFLEALRRDVWTLEPTRIGLISAVGAALVSVLALWQPQPTRVTHARGSVALSVAVASLAVVGLASHTGTSSDHETSVNAMAIHIVAVAAWFGGLMALVAVRGAVTRQPTPAVERWSSIALWCYVAVAFSGTVAATTRLGSWSDLGTAYGVLIIVKVVAFVSLGWAGWSHRRYTIPRLPKSASAFWRLVAGELVVMAGAVGVGTALARSAPPVPEDVLEPTPALALTGFPAPPAPTTWSWLVGWRTDWLFLALAVVAIGMYAAGLVALRRSRRGWPGWRTTAWMLGWVVFTVVTSGGVATYARVALSWHVAFVAVELLVVPLLLVMGDPIGLSTKVFPRREDGTLGPREFLDLPRGGEALRVLGLPAVAAGLTALVLVVLVLGPGLDWTLWSHPWHVVVSVGLPLLGFGFVCSVLRAARPLGAVLSLGLVILLLALALGMGTRPLAADFFGPLELPWVHHQHTDPLTGLLADQRRGGLVLGVIGGVALGALTLMVRGGGARGLPVRDAGEP